MMGSWHRRERPARGYNELKCEALCVFENRGWIRPRDWAAWTHFRPVRASYSYLLHLHRQGLLRRFTRGVRGRVLYCISKKGRERLTWLRGL